MTKIPCSIAEPLDQPLGKDQKTAEPNESSKLDQDDQGEGEALSEGEGESESDESKSQEPQLDHNEINEKLMGMSQADSVDHNADIKQNRDIEDMLEQDGIESNARSNLNTPDSSRKVWLLTSL